VGGLDKAFLAGVNPGTFAATFSNGVYLPELVFVMFQMTFACITPALIVGAFAERVKFTSLIIFVVAWMTLAYFPIAHMVWYWAGPDFLHTAPTDMGLLWGWGALDFAGGTVVHINAGVAGLIGCLIIGPRIGYKKEPMPPHSLVMTMIGASLLWIGWFGFNAGSALESNAFGLGDHRTDHPQEALAARRSFGCGGRPRGDHSGGGLCPPRHRDHPRRCRFGGMLLLRHHGEEQARL
jgi:Amt family ammonium transporter